MKLILTGATGVAGSAVLREALASSEVEKVCVISRRMIDLDHPKLEVMLHADFTNYEGIVDRLVGYDACLWCLGISQNAVGGAEYVKITYDYAIAAAEAMKSSSPNFTFCFLSGQGADSKEQSRVLFSRVKGQTENALDRILPRVFHFRPGYIHAVHQKPKRWFEKLFEPLTPLMYRVYPKMILSTVELAHAMLRVAKHGAPKKILENQDLRAIASGQS